MFRNAGGSRLYRYTGNKNDARLTQQKRQRSVKPQTYRFLVAGFVSVLCLMALMALLAQNQVNHDDYNKTDAVANGSLVQNSNELGRRMISQRFPSLVQPLEEFEMVGVYFAAAWCPMSTPVTELFDQVFRSVLTDPNNHRFALVFVSSDASAREFRTYLKPGWRTVPFESEEERATIKTHFRICAKKEMQALGLDSRNDEIPHLKILTGRDAIVLSTNAISDVKERGIGALDYWISLKKESTMKVS